MVLLPAARRRVLLLAARSRGVALPGQPPTAPKVKWWLMDTGCGFDLVDHGVTAKLKRHVRPVDERLLLNTANGELEVRKQIDLKIPELGEQVTALVLPSTPSVLSIGKRCMREGYHFEWKPYSPPTLITPSGLVIELVVEEDVPYLASNALNGNRVVGPGVAPGDAHAPAGTATLSLGEPLPAVPGIDKPEVPHEIVAPPAPVSGGVASGDAHGDGGGAAPGGASDDDDGADDVGGPRNLKAEAISLRHLMTHMPKNPWCPACQRAKMQRRSCRRVDGPEEPIPPEFGIIVTADHLIAHSEKSMGMTGEQDALVVKDRGTGWLECVPLASKSADDAYLALQDIRGPKGYIHYLYTDNSRELIKAAQDLGIPHGTSTPGRPQTNGVAERAVRSVVEGTRTCLEHAGFPPSFWPLACRHFTFAANVAIKEGDSPWNLRHQKGQFKGPLIPFGCLVDFMQLPPLVSGQAKFAPKATPGLFLGYHLLPGGLWGGDYLVASLAEFAHMGDGVAPGDAIPLIGVASGDADNPEGLPMGFRGGASGRVRVQRVKEIYRDAAKGFIFPLKAAFEKRTRTLPGPTAEVEASAFDCPGEVPLEAPEEATGVIAVEPVPPVLSYEKGVGGTFESGRYVRNYKGTTRPPHVPPEAWQAMSPKWKKTVIERYKASLEAKAGVAPGGAGSSGDDPPPPAAPVVPAASVPGGESADVLCFLRGLVGLLGSAVPDGASDPSVASGDATVPSCQHACAAPGGAKWPLPDVPRMPVAAPATGGLDAHRDHEPDFVFPFSACVARPVSKKEAAGNPKAQAALLKEWDRLRASKCWDETRVREWADVAGEARRSGATHHVGRIFEICVEKNAELHEDNPLRKFKGRVVFQGNQVRDENWEAAMFQELSSCPATMEAAKAADCYGLLEGHVVEQADAEQAYTQSKLGGTPTWIRLPRERWPQAWANMRDPVCPLVLALYGHPDAGGYWERHCAAHLRSVGFQDIPDWRSCFWHPRYKVYLTVYVDDFKMAGPKPAMASAWADIRKGVKTGDPEPAGFYLGCRHVLSVRTSPLTGKPVRVIEYDMEEFLVSCVERYKELGAVTKLRTVSTPFLELPPSDTIAPGESVAGAASGGATPKGAASGGADAPPLQPGVLQPIAARVLMKVLYGARMARFDLLKAVCSLACCVTKWDLGCDRKLHRLMCYIHSTHSLRMTGWIGDPLDKLSLHLFADADFAGCASTARSTSGVFLCLKGPDSFMGLTGMSKRQTCVSHSTPESEIVAADCALRLVGLPALQLWDALLPRKAHITFHEDNQAMIRVCETGRNPTMRHLGRTHRVDVAWLHERFQEPTLTLVYEKTDAQAADIFTKAFSNPETWHHVCGLIHHVDPSAFWPPPVPGRGGPHPRTSSLPSSPRGAPGGAAVTLCVASGDATNDDDEAAVMTSVASGDATPTRVLLLATRLQAQRSVLLLVARLTQGVPLWSSAAANRVSCA